MFGQKRIWISAKKIISVWLKKIWQLLTIQEENKKEIQILVIVENSLFAPVSFLVKLLDAQEVVGLDRRHQIIVV